MTLNAWLSFAPQLIVATGIVVTLLIIAWRRTYRLIANVTLLVIVLAFVCCLWTLNQPSTELTQLINIDDFGRFAFLWVLVAAGAGVVFGKNELAQSTEVHDEYYLLLLLVVLGAGILVVSQHFASLFLGFELLSISLVGMTGYFRQHTVSVEVSFKYLILSASASSFMLLGIAFIYAHTGTLSFNFSSQAVDNSMVMQLGLLLMFSGLAFKLSLVPFHYWTPDVYQGAKTSVTFLLATISKSAMFIVLYKVLVQAGLVEFVKTSKLIYVLSAIAILSMIVGNSLAIGQQNIKRILAYSSLHTWGTSWC